MLRIFTFLLLCVNVSALVTKQNEGHGLEKVIKLLEGLKGEVQQEKKAADEQQYEYKMFCAKQSLEKANAIKNSDDLIKRLEAELAELNSEMKKQDHLRLDARDHVHMATDDLEHVNHYLARKQEHFEEDAATVKEAITACEKVIKVLRDSKQNMKGAKLDLFAEKVLNAVSNSSTIDLSKHQMEKVTSLIQNPPHAYAYQSNEIISLFEGFMDSFKTELQDATTIYLDNKKRGENEKGHVTKLLSSYENDLSEATVALKEATASHEKKDGQRLEEVRFRKADTQFKDELDKECEARATQHKNNQATRTAELEALGSAIETLAKKSDTYGSTSHSSRYGLVETETSFLQLKKSVTSKTVLRAENAVNYIQNEAKNLDSPVLSMIALTFQHRIAMGKDVFKVIRERLQNLVDNLNAQLQKEADTNTFCTEQRSKIDKDIADSTSAIVSENEKLAQANKDIRQFSYSKKLNEDELAAIRASEKKRSELFDKELSDLKTLIATNEEGLAATKEALTTLKGFYGFVQESGDNSSINAKDRDGNNRLSIQPSDNPGSYKGSHKKATGILGMIEVIIGDFNSSVKAFKNEQNELEQNNRDALDAFTQAETATDSALNKAKSNLSGAQSDKNNAEDELVNQEEKLSDAEALKAKIYDICYTTGQDKDKQTKLRAQEVAVLKRAYEILDAASL